MIALGLIESIGYSTAVTAADAAVKAADVEILGTEKVIGVDGYVGVTIHLSGDVAAVTSAVEAGTNAGESIGNIVSSHVIPRTDANVKDKLIDKFMDDSLKDSQEHAPKKVNKEVKETNKKSSNINTKEQPDEKSVKKKNGTSNEG